MPSVFLTKALKLKNRLVGRLAQVQSDIQSNNTRYEGQQVQVDVLALSALREELVTAVIDLKTEIERANHTTIDRIIRQLGEHKSTLVFLKGLTTTDGLQPNHYAEKDLAYVSVIKKPDVDAKVKLIEKEIDDLQDQIDAYNGTTRITVPQRTLDLAS